MKGIRTKIAAVLAFIIGAMAVFAGGKVLIGIDPGYPVIDWLPLYNYSIGLITVLITSILLWKNHRLAKAAALATLSLHVIVMILLQTAFRATVAPESIQAMTIRIITWTMINIVLLVPSFARSKVAAARSAKQS